MCPVVCGWIHHIQEQLDGAVILSAGQVKWFTISCFGAEMSPHAILGIRPFVPVASVGHEWLADGRAGPSCIMEWQKRHQHNQLTNPSYFIILAGGGHVQPGPGV